MVQRSSPGSTTLVLPESPKSHAGTLLGLFLTLKMTPKPSEPRVTPLIDLVSAKTSALVVPLLRLTRRIITHSFG